MRTFLAAPLEDVTKLRWQAVFLMGAGGSGKGFVGRKWLKYMPGAPSTGLDYNDPKHKELLKKEMTEAERGQTNLDFNKVLMNLKAQGIDLVACLSVNDAFVMKAWAEAHDALGQEQA